MKRHNHWQIEKSNLWSWTIIHSPDYMEALPECDTICKGKPEDWSALQYSTIPAQAQPDIQCHPRPVSEWGNHPRQVSDCQHRPRPGQSEGMIQEQGLNGKVWHDMAGIPVLFHNTQVF